MEADWAIAFAESGPLALECLDQLPFDAIVVDLGMSALDGRLLLEQVARLHPMTLRIAFSDPGHPELLGGSIGLVHQALTMPFQADDLIAMIGNAFRLGSAIVDDRVKTAIGRMDCLPTLPRLYQELRDVLEGEDATAKLVGGIIRQDVGMTAKILKLVNSSFFGLRRTVESLQEAVAFLGTETIKVLVLAHGLFDQTGALETKSLTLEDIWRHSLSVAEGARALAAMEGLSRPHKAEAFMGGMLHDVGIIVLAKNFPDRYDRVVHLSAAEQLSVCSAEQREFGLGHAEVGAYLLGLWGPQPAVLKAVSLHHTPSALLATAFNPVLAIHLADNLCGTQGHHALFERSELDERALAAFGIRDQMAGWRQVLAKTGW
jgi:HD-like signal output (HDOD) protein